MKMSSMHSYKIIDAHTHIYPEAIAEKACVSLGQFYDFEVRAKGTYADLSGQSRASNTVGFFLLSVATNGNQVPKVNDKLAAVLMKARDEGFEAIGFAAMHQDCPDFAGEIDRCVGLGLRGVKVHPDIQRMDIAGERMRDLCACLVERHLPLFLHMGDNRPEYRYSEPGKLAALLDEFPTLTAIAAHYGGYMAWDEAVEALAGRPNVWYDCSSALWAMSPERAAELTRLMGVDRVMYGTDYPVCNLKEHFELFLKLPLTEEERAAVIYDNAHRFIAMAENFELSR
ncbi:MAG: amidohydrolase [Clostridiales bacterium]|nr:amidohydrolase [Clostridiales bacterium]